MYNAFGYYTKKNNLKEGFDENDTTFNANITNWPQIQDALNNENSNFDGTINLDIGNWDQVTQGLKDHLEKRVRKLERPRAQKQLES